MKHEYKKYKKQAENKNPPNEKNREVLEKTLKGSENS
jgi:hypothetical protein